MQKGQKTDLDPTIAQSLGDLLHRTVDGFQALTGTGIQERLRRTLQRAIR